LADVIYNSKKTNQLFSDRVRTSVNVLGDAFAASAVAHYLQEQLDKNDQNDYHHEIKEEIGKLDS
jgi:Na+/H+-dicarboxylate symporter